jgi:hypothetical protein
MTKHAAEPYTLFRCTTHGTTDWRKWREPGRQTPGQCCKVRSVAKFHLHRQVIEWLLVINSRPPPSESTCIMITSNLKTEFETNLEMSCVTNISQWTMSANTSIRKQIIYICLQRNIKINYYTSVNITKMLLCCRPICYPKVTAE